MGLKWPLAAVLLILQLSICSFANEPFVTKPVELPHAHSALHIVHRDRAYSGGFSALWVSPDCSDLITISDYSQAQDSYLDSHVRRSGWFAGKLDFGPKGKLQQLTLTNQGQLLDLNGKVLPGAVESMEWDGSGFLISFDDRGDIYRYKGKTPQGQLFNNKPTVAYKQSNLGSGNSGLEALTVLASGEVFALWEKINNESFARGRVIQTNGKLNDFVYEAQTSPGGATTLADGSVLILEKEWLGIGKGQRLRLLSLAPELFTPSPTQLKGELLLEKQDLRYDNHEGISSCIKDGKEWIFVITDDNGDWPERAVEQKGKPRQRTLLMQIDLNQLKS